MTPEEKQFTVDQLKLLERTRKAALHHRLVAADAHNLNLPILAREHDHVAKLLEEAAATQMRAFRDKALGGKE